MLVPVRTAGDTPATVRVRANAPDAAARTKRLLGHRIGFRWQALALPGYGGVAVYGYSGWNLSGVW